MINLSVPLNSLSFGFVSQSILVELFKRNISANIFPIGNQVDLSSYPALAKLEGFENCFKQSIQNSLERFNKNDPSFNLWHILGSEQSHGVRRNTLTFHELDSLTKTESNILANIDSVFLSSKYSQEVFKSHGINSIYCPLGFDSLHFKKTNRKYFNDDRIVISVFGKCELSRKRHSKVIPALVKKFGGDRRYAIHLSIYNTFLNQDQNNQLVLQLLGGSKPFNFNILPYTKTLDEFNHNLNCTNVVIDGGNESWSVPSFSAIALGAYGVLGNYGALKDWGAGTNSEMIESCGKIPVYDNMFFREGGNTNQGNIFDINEDDIISATERAIEKYKNNPINSAGLSLQEKFTWSKTTDIILKNLK